MATSSCPKCGSTSFETATVEPSGSAFKLVFVQCAVCGGVVGVVEYNNVGSMIDRQNKAIREIARKVGALINL
jgi:hypothetical protein